MSDNPATVYRSTNEGVLAAHQVQQVRLDHLNEGIRALIAEYPKHKPIVIQSGSTLSIKGLESMDAAPDLDMPGWRYKKYGHWYPDLRRAAGKRIAARLASYAYQQEGLPGMPRSHVTGRLYWLTPVFRSDGDDAVLALWGDDTTSLEGSAHGIDMLLWSRVPLSEFHALQEAATA